MKISNQIACFSAMALLFLVSLNSTLAVADEESGSQEICGDMTYLSVLYVEEREINNISLRTNDGVIKIKDDYPQYLINVIRRIIGKDLVELDEKPTPLADEGYRICLINPEIYTYRYDGKTYRGVKKASGVKVYQHGKKIERDDRLTTELDREFIGLAAYVAKQRNTTISQHCVYRDQLPEEPGVVLYLLPFGAERYDCEFLDEWHSGIHFRFNEDGKFISMTVVDA